MRRRSSRAAHSGRAIAGLALAGVLLLHGPQAMAQSISGVVSRVIDGDTLVVGGAKIRLAGVDAPELKTPTIGLLARQHLLNLVAYDQVQCVSDGSRSYDRIVATCRSTRAGDLASRMVRDGWAVDWQRFSGGRHRHAQALAMRERAGAFSYVSEPWR